KLRQATVSDLADVQPPDGPRRDSESTGLPGKDARRRRAGQHLARSAQSNRIRAGGVGGEPLRDPVPEEDGEVENITAFYDVFRSSRTGTVIRRNYRRADGSLLLTDVRDPKFGARFVLHSPSGTPMAEWRRPRDFYNAW